MKHNKVDTSNELEMVRFNNGIKLVKPDSSKRSLNNPNLLNVSQFLDLPFPSYIEDTNHITKRSNEITAIECGFESFNDFINKPWFKHFKRDTVEQTLLNDTHVLKSKTTKYFQEYALLKNNDSVETLSLRMPWYNTDNKIAGLIGCSIVLNKNSLAESLNKIANLGLLNFDQIQYAESISGRMVNSVFLSKRELDCLQLTIRGKTAKQIAELLCLSKYTIEEYLSNIKRKMQVNSKSELIDKVIDHFF